MFFHASSDFCRLLITFANSLNNGPDLFPFDTLIVFLEEFFEKFNFEKKSGDNKKKHRG